MELDLSPGARRRATEARRPGPPPPVPSRPATPCSGPAMRPARLAAFAALSSCLLSGCSTHRTDDAERYFARQIAKALEGRDSAVVDAAQLTDFDWRQLCFGREDRLELTFSGAGAERVFRFGHEDYFVAEPYVERSPAERCIGRQDKLALKKKYPGRKDTVEFQLAEDAAAS